MQIPRLGERRDGPPRVAHTKARCRETWRRLALRLRGFVRDGGGTDPAGSRDAKVMAFIVAFSVSRSLKRDALAAARERQLIED